MVFEKGLTHKTKTGSARTLPAFSKINQNAVMLFSKLNCVKV